jgi:hypothetical protein
VQTLQPPQNPLHLQQHPLLLSQESNLPIQREPTRFFSLLACRQQAAPAWIYPNIPPKPTTPAKAAPSLKQTTPVTSPDDKSSVITENTPINPEDPLPTQKTLRFFLEQRTTDQQEEAVEGNLYYFSSLVDWKERLNEDDLSETLAKFLPHLPRIRELIKYGNQYYQGLSRQLAQLKTTNNQLREENNRFSSAPSPKHKDPAFSKLQEDHQRLVNQHNDLVKEYEQFTPLFQEYPDATNAQELVEHYTRLNQEVTDLQRESLELRSKARESDKLRKQIRQIFSIFPTISSPQELEEEIELLKNTERNANTRAQALEAALSDWENVGKILVPNSLHAYEAAERATQLIKQTMSAPDESSRMSGALPNSLTAEDCATIWNQLPDITRQRFKRKTPSTPVELMDALAGVRPPPEPCVHPQQAAVALGDASGNQPWDASIEQMERDAQHICPTLAQTVPIPITTQRLFKVSEVPELSNTKEYELYRSQLQRFLRAHGNPQQHEFGQALERILQAFTAPSAQVAAASWKVTDLIRPSWEETTNALVRALDEKFEDNNVLEEAMLKWYRTQLKDGADINEFFNHYEAAADVYLLAQIRKGIPTEAQISPAVVTARLVQILPSYLRNALKLRLTSQGIMWEALTLKQLRPHLEDLWRYLPKPAAAGHNTNTRFQTASNRLTPAQQNPTQNPRGGRANETKQRQCGMMVSYDTSPPVPQQARGSLYPDPRDPSKNTENLRRLHYCAQHDLCTFCRRDRAQHQPSGPNFKAVTIPANTRAAPAQEQEPTPNERIDGHLLLAPPASS